MGEVSRREAITAAFANLRAARDQVACHSSDALTATEMLACGAK